MKRELAARLPRYLLAAAAGIATVVVSLRLDMPGGGEFLLVAAVAGFAAALVAPDRVGWGCLTGSVAAAVAIPAATRGFAGLWALIIGSLVVPATAGWLLGWSITLAYRMGWRAAVRNRKVLGALAGVAAIVALIWALAVEFATSPP